MLQSRAVLFRQRKAIGSLAHLIDYFWFYQDLDVDHSIEKLLPNAAIEIIIDLSQSSKKFYDRNDRGRFRECRRAWVSCLQPEYIVIGAERGSSMMGVHFHPGGAAPFFDFPISELTGSVIELDLIWKRELYHLRDDLLDQPEVSRKFDLLESYLLSKARGRLEPDRLLTAALSSLCTWPLLPVGELVGQIGVTQKQLIAQFYRRVGCTPKLTSRIMRFQKLLAAINGSKSPDWAALAVDHGYYDQPHLIHEFQEFAGVTPSQYISQCTAHPDYLVVR